MTEPISPVKVTDDTKVGDHLYRADVDGYRRYARILRDTLLPEDAGDGRLVMLSVEQDREGVRFAQVTWCGLSTWNQLCEDPPMVESMFQSLQHDIKEMERS